jgi:hypothetical protein
VASSKDKEYLTAISRLSDQINGLVAEQKNITDRASRSTRRVAWAGVATTLLSSVITGFVVYTTRSRIDCLDEQTKAQTLMHKFGVEAWEPLKTSDPVEKHCAINLYVKNHTS